MYLCLCRICRSSAHRKSTRNNAVSSTTPQTTRTTTTPEVHGKWLNNYSSPRHSSANHHSRRDVSSPHPIVSIDNITTSLPRTRKTRLRIPVRRRCRSSQVRRYPRVHCDRWKQDCSSIRSYIPVRRRIVMTMIAMVRASITVET